MKKNVSLRLIAMTAMVLGLAPSMHLSAQTQITAHAGAGISDIEVNGLGVLDLVDPYIRSVGQYTVGLQYEKGLSPRWAVVSGAQYTSRGFAARESFNVDVFGLDIPVGASLETRLNYMEVPLMLKYNLTTEGVTPYIQAGASAAYALQGKITPRIDAFIPFELPAIHINLQNDMYNRWDISAVAGAGIRIPTNGTGAFQLEAQYRHSLNDMFLDQITDIRIKSHGVSGSIGYSVRF